MKPIKEVIDEYTERYREEHGFGPKLKIRLSLDAAHALDWSMLRHHGLHDPKQKRVCGHAYYINSAQVEPYEIEVIQ